MQKELEKMDKAVRCLMVELPAPVYLGVWDKWQALKKASGTERNELLDLLEKLFDLYESGEECYEDPDERDGYLGNAVKLDQPMFGRIADILNKHRPVEPAAGGFVATNWGDDT